MNAMLNDTWRNISEIIIYGLGMVGRKYFDMLQRDFKIKFIVDSSPCTSLFKGVKVISLAEMLEVRKREKIVVLASREAYMSIKQDLDQNDMTEYDDYIRFDDFVTDWYWQMENKSCIREVHVATNTNCTFNCQKCNMFIPHYRSTVIYTLEETKKSLDAFFPLVDFVFVLSYLGGEPFLNHELKDIIEYTYETYRDKIGRIEIVTNGSVTPDSEILEAIHRTHTLVRISDYTEHIRYEEKLQQLMGILEQYGIDYSVEKSLEWVDFCFPDGSDKCQFPIKDVRTHMLCCAPVFHGLNDGKFYYCHVAWSAERAGLIKLNEGDYINLADYSINAESKRKLVEYANGSMKNGYVSLCEKCMGCGRDNHFVVPAGQQAERIIHV